MLLTCFSSPGLLLQSHQQGGKNQLHPMGTQVSHHSLGTVICSLVQENAEVKKLRPVRGEEFTCYAMRLSFNI